MTHPLSAHDSERALVASVLSRATLEMMDAGDPVFRDVSPDQFADPGLRSIWRAVTDLAGQDVDPTPAAINARLEEFGAGEHRKTVLALASEMDTGSPSYHAGILKDRASRRRLVEASRLVGEKAHDLEASLSDVLDESERLIFGATMTKGPGSLVPALVKKTMNPVVELIMSGGYKGTPTGLHDLDAMLTGGGVLPGQMVVVAGATAMGKSALCLGIAANMAMARKKTVVLFSIEMTSEDNTLRLLCHEAVADLKAVSEGRARDHDLNNLTTAATALAAAPLYLHDSANTVNQIRSAARRLKAEDGALDLVIVDHIQDMEGPGDNRREQLGGIARGLKGLAKELGCAIIAVSQLGREVSKRPDPTPRISDLKESGDIENSADTVWLLYRPEYYFGPEKDGKDLRNKAKLIVGKQRNGQTGAVDLRWLPASVRFDNIDRGKDWRAA